MSGFRNVSVRPGRADKNPSRLAQGFDQLLCAVVEAAKLALPKRDSTVLTQSPIVPGGFRREQLRK
jgi:hypothetical protein